MPHSPTRRFENCYMPPKKFAWRFDSIKSSESSTAFVEETKFPASVDKEKQSMGLMYNEQTKASPAAVESLLSERQMSPELYKQPPQDDGPLDFSLKNSIRVSNKRLSSSPHSSLKNDEFKYPLEYLQKCASVFIPNGKSSSPPMSNNHLRNWFLKANAWNKSDDQSCDGNKTSSNMECSENLNEDFTSVSMASGLSGGTMLYRKSPERSISRESSPVPESPILEGMLKSQGNGGINNISSKIQNCHISASESKNTDTVNAINSVMTAANSQPIMPALLPPVNNLVPFGFPTYPYLNGLSCVRPPVSALAGGLVSPTTESTVLQALTQRRPRRKRSDERPFKSYPIDVIEEKLHSVSALALGLQYSSQVASNGPTTKSPPSDLSCSPSMGESREHVNNGAINSTSTHATNGEDNSHVSGDSNDSISVSRTETAEATSCTNSRKRKSTGDLEKDDAYWDRRRKNNLAAKRSREARRRKEDAIANMAILYENQNVELQQNIAVLNFNLNEANTRLSRLMREHESLTIQNNILQERLAQKRCGNCGRQLPNVN